MANLVENHSFEDATLSPWQTSGDVTREEFVTAFEGDHIANVGLTVPGDISAISQLFLVPVEGTGLRIAYALRPESAATNGRFRVRVQWFGSANDGLPLLREDTIDNVEAESMDPAVWLTRIAVTPERPEGAVWVRVRFIAATEGSAVGDLRLDDVVVTAQV